MTIHYHGGPFTPEDLVLPTLKGKHFCVSHSDPRQVRQLHEIGQSVMLDNGAFSKHTVGKATDWTAYYAWAEEWTCATTWCVIPDVIDAGSQEQDALIREHPESLRPYSSPVWHSSEPIDRLWRLIDEWPRVCVGSTDEHWRILGPAWRERMQEVFDGIAGRYRKVPNLHMLRGMQLSKHHYPFASLDSTDVAQNHHRHGYMGALARASRWDAMQCPRTWEREWTE